MRDQKNRLIARDCGMVAYSSKGGATATAVNFFCKFPSVAIKQSREDGLDKFRRC